MLEILSFKFFLNPKLKNMKLDRVKKGNKETLYGWKLAPQPRSVQAYRYCALADCHSYSYSG